MFLESKQKGEKNWMGPLTKTPQFLSLASEIRKWGSKILKCLPPGVITTSLALIICTCTVYFHFRALIWQLSLCKEFLADHCKLYTDKIFNILIYIPNFSLCGRNIFILLSSFVGQEQRFTLSTSNKRNQEFSYCGWYVDYTVNRDCWKMWQDHEDNMDFIT